MRSKKERKVEEGEIIKEVNAIVDTKEYDCGKIFTPEDVENLRKLGGI